MLYILPPPSAPSPPSPWASILCNNGQAGGGAAGSSGPGVEPTAARRVGATWIAKATVRLPPRAPKTRDALVANDSGAGGSGEDDDPARNSRSLSECYFAGKGAALVLPPNERVRPSRRASGGGPDIQQHLQSMFYLLRPEETLKMAVKLESAHAGRTRYLVVVSCVGRQDAEESCLLGIDCNDRTTVGLVLRVLADTAITLDGDGGFSVSVCGRQHIFKPVSVQAMWSALQTLHKVSCKAREQNYFQGGLTHDWVSYYEQRIESDRSCLNEWHAMDNLESRRPPSPDSVRTKPREREETERVIRSTLKEIMMSVDLDEVTSKYIRSRLEEDLDMDLGEYKSFIDQEMLTILGQMDAATEVFEHVYLGSEWNASNLEELQKNGVRHILNVTKEIDNFFPGMFNYQNIRVYDDEKTDLLKHWDNTFKYITNAKKEGSKVLVHCKMGVSRSASVVIAYAMKAYNWDYKRAFDYVKQKRNCIKPNTSFISQLETYQGILDAMKNREKLQRSKSETNLKSPGLSAKSEQTGSSRSVGETSTSSCMSHDQCTENVGLLSENKWNLQTSGLELSRHGCRPKSWSPDNSSATALLSNNIVTGPASVSLEQLHLNISKSKEERSICFPTSCTEKAVQLSEPVECSTGTFVTITTTATTSTITSSTTATAALTATTTVTSATTATVMSQETSKRVVSPLTQVALESEARNYRMPCKNGQAYSISQNKVVHLPGSSGTVIPSVKCRVNELESQSGQATASSSKKCSIDRKGMVLNLTSQFESSGSKPGSPVDQEIGEEYEECVNNELVDNCENMEEEEEEEPVISQTKLAPQMLTAVLVKKEIWDPGEKESPTTCAVEQVGPFTSVSSFVPSTENLVWTASTGVIEKRVPEISDVKYDAPMYISEVKHVESEKSENDVTRTNLENKLEVNMRSGTKKDGDPFSAQVDRVFDREERKQQRASIAAVPVTTAPAATTTITTTAATVPPAPLCLTEPPTDALSRECPSRQSSWSSYDSAVVLGYQGEPRNAPSRQSSWGSGDTRWTYGGTLPSRNSSWGSYDMKPPAMQHVTEQGEREQLMEDLFGSSSSGMFPYDRDDIPWYPGTVRRTKQKLEEGTNTVKRVCSDSQPRSTSTSPPSSTYISHSPTRTVDISSGMNMKIHGPRPYQSPSTDRFLPTTGFPFPPCSEQRHDMYPVDKSPPSTMANFDAQNTALIHYASSPTLSSDTLSHTDALNIPSTDKMAASQPNITLLDSCAISGEETPQPSAICRDTDFSCGDCSSTLNLSSVSLTENACLLSTSALETTPTSSVLDSMVSQHLCTLPTTLATYSNSSENHTVSVHSVISVPSPCIVHTTQCPSVKHQKKVLENLTNISNKNIVKDDLTINITKDSLPSTKHPDKDSKSVSGLVKNLKKEFEAKSVSKTERSVMSSENYVDDTDCSCELQSKCSENIKVRSLPSSPVSIHPECKSPNSLSPSSTTEDLSVKKLVGKYEVGKTRVQSPVSGGRPRFISENENIPQKAQNSDHQRFSPTRKSSLDIETFHQQNNSHMNKHSLYLHNMKNSGSSSNSSSSNSSTSSSCSNSSHKECTDEFRRIPTSASLTTPTSSAVVASVIAKAASKKQQQGKTHPLSRLSITKPRHNNPVYNTM